MDRMVIIILWSLIRIITRKEHKKKKTYQNYFFSYHLIIVYKIKTYVNPIQKKESPLSLKGKVYHSYIQDRYNTHNSPQVNERNLLDLTLKAFCLYVFNT